MYKNIEKPQDLDSRHPASAGYDAYNELIKMSENSGEVNRNLLMRIIEDNKDTVFGKEHGFEEIKSVEDYKKRVPFTEYDDYAEAIERMTHGETGLITNYPIVHYAVTSGSMDNPKNIPVSQESLELYNNQLGSIAQMIYDHALRSSEGRAPNFGTQFTTTVVNIDEVADGTMRGPISSAIYLKQKPFIGQILPWPIEVMFPEGKQMDHRYLRAFYGLKDRNVTSLVAPFITALVDNMHYIEINWENLVRDIEEGVLDPDVNIDPEVREKLQAELEPDPKRAAELRAIFEEGFDEPFVPKVWPNVDYVSGTIGGSFSQYLDKIKNYTGELPIYSNAYSSSEASLAVALEMDKPIYAFMPLMSYFEFIPIGEETEETLDIDELEDGREYEVVVTNLSGLYRYKLGDVVGVVGHVGDLPVIEFKYRKKQMINIAGEKTNESHLNWVIQELEKETGVNVTDYSIYADTTNLPGRYVLFLETQDGETAKNDRSGLRDISDDKMGERNPSYGAKVRDGLLLPMELLFVQPETYYLYRDLMILRGTSENQIKPVRVIDTPRKEAFFFSLVDK